MTLKLGLLILLATLASAQDCDPSSQVAFDVEVTADDVMPFVALTPPDTCEGFELTELLACQAEINVKEGCCTTSCKDVLKKVDNACLADITDLGCNEGAASLIPYLDSLVARCGEGDPLPLACDAAVTRVELAQATETEEDCSERIEADEPVDSKNCTADYLCYSPVAAIIRIPASCAGFSVTDLLGCQAEINVVEGCCEDTCKDIFVPVSRECMEDIGYLICTSDTAEAFSILNRVAQRCHTDPSNLTCEELIAQGPPKALGPTAESIDDILVEDIPEASTTDSEDEATFFGSSEPTEAETEEEESFFGVSDGSPADEETFFGVQDVPADTASDSSEASCEEGEIDENVDVNHILEVLSAADDTKCPGFGSETFTCNSDITLMGNANCCESECRSFMEGLSDECIDEVLRVSCIQSEFDTHEIFERTAKRCITDYVPRTCEALSKNSASKLTIIGSVFGGVLLAAMLLI